MKNKVFVILFISLNYFSVCSQENTDISIKMIANNCNGCHGLNGNGGGSSISIREKDYEYFINKMKQYKNTANNSIMNRLTSVLSISDIKKLGKYYYPDHQNEF